MTGTGPVVALRALSFVYPGPPPVQALREIDLSVDRNEYVAISGPSGSGKSTLLNVIGLLERPTAGRFELDGVDTGDLREAQRTALRAGRIGFVFQAFHLMPHRSAAENVGLALLYGAAPRRDRARLAAGALDRVGLTHRGSALAANLSGGERQRVAIARALVTRPSLLLCDEPTGNLDSGNASQVLDLIDELHRDGMTVIMITHDGAVAGRAGRAVRMHDGAVAAVSP